MFDLTEDQELIRETVREFAQLRLAPTVKERDIKDHFERSLFDEMGELGFAGLYFPEEFGGTGTLDYLAYILTVEELSRVDDGIGITLSAHVSLAANPIQDFGTPEQQERFLTPLAAGTKLGAFALTEPGAGTDAAGQRTTAVRDGEDYVLNGSKIFITNGGEAEIYIVFAVTDKEAGTRGITAFVVEQGMPGFTVDEKEHKLGIRTSMTTGLSFHDVRVPAANRLGQEGEGFKIAMKTLDGGRIGVAAQALGIAQGAYEHAVAYAKERIQFGKPIAAQQAVSFKLADMATEIDAARLLVYRAADLKQKGRPFGKEAAMAKVFASDVAMRVTTEAIQVFGGYGYSEDYPVARYFRNAKITQIYEGTNEAQRMVISAAILR